MDSSEDGYMMSELELELKKEIEKHTDIIVESLEIASERPEPPGGFLVYVFTNYPLSLEVGDVLYVLYRYSVRIDSREYGTIYARVMINVTAVEELIKDDTPF